MTKAVRVHKVGGPEALVYEAVEVPPPEPARYASASMPSASTSSTCYYRTGLYKAPQLPFVAGNEAAGEVVAVGPGVTNFHPGDRVAYYHNLGAYASERNMPCEKLVKLPDHITYEQGAVLMLKGLTVWYLLHKTFRIEPGHRDSDPCRGGRHRPAGLPMGESARGPCHRYGGLEGQGRPRARQWLRSRHPLQ